MPRERGEGTVEKLVSGGMGLVRWDGLVVLLPGSLPGERVQFQITKREKNWARAEVVTILTSAPERRPPPCPVYGRCGGCDFMHLTEAAQRQAKALLVQESFARIGGKTIELPPITGGQAWNYRVRLQLHKAATDQPAGFLAAQSHAIIPIQDCPIAAVGFQALLAQGGADLPVGRTNLFAPAQTVYRAGLGTEVPLNVLGKTIWAPVDGFFQSNLELLPALIEAVLADLPASGSTALDLYCGSGLFGAFLADRFQQVIAVEENVQALNLARKNILGPQHQFFAQSLEQWVRRLKTASRPQRWQAIVVDPPRTGLSTATRAFLSQYPTPALTYVSCNPDTLARDTQSLEAGGYRLAKLQLFDFYPQTSHVEAVAHFRRAP